MSSSLGISSWVRITSEKITSSFDISNFTEHADNQNVTNIYRKLNIDYPKFFKMDGQSKLGFVGAYILLDDIRAELHANDEAVALLFANSSSSLQTDRKYQETIGKHGTGSPAKFVYTLPNIVIGEVCIYWKQYNETQLLVLTKFDSETLLKHAEIMFAESDCKHVLIGWTEVGNDRTDGLFVLVTKNGSGVATVNDLSQLYSQ